MESYIEHDELKQDTLLEYQAIRNMLGHILLENKLGNNANDDIVYYSRKLKEIQERLKR